MDFPWDAAVAELGDPRMVVHGSTMGGGGGGCGCELVDGMVDIVGILVDG